MPEFFLELFSEEIPARMQREAGVQLEKICSSALAGLKIQVVEVFTGPRRMALKAVVNAQTEAREIEERGPRESAPEAALAGFLGKHKASRADVVAEGGYFLLRRREAAVAARDLIFSALPGALAKFAWPKSMRWGQSGEFTWVRPLRRVVCLLDGAVVPFALGPVVAGNVTEGHRFLAPGAFEVVSAADWQEKLRERFVIADQNERRELVVSGLAKAAVAVGLTVAEDAGLVDEVTGLVEWPVALVGRIDEGFMELPPEVRELSMKVNQRYFALRDAEGKPAARFGFVSNITAADENAAIVAGNERVLRARLSDARHFWEMDLKTPLNVLLDKLRHVVFHNKIGTQHDRVTRLQNRAQEIARKIGGTDQDVANADAAALFSKLDLVTHMVGEFPELQGIIGGYYSQNLIKEWGQGADLDTYVVSHAVKTHYQPKGPNDSVPKGVVSASVALADKIDTLQEFFQIDEIPTGSSDPYALRRAALGISRIIIENQIHVNLGELLLNDEVFEFVIERLRQKLRSEGKRHDILAAVFATARFEELLEMLQIVEKMSIFLQTEDGANLLSSYRRVASILKSETENDRFFGRFFDPSLLRERAEIQLSGSIDLISGYITNDIENHRYGDAMQSLAETRRYVDRFFEEVTVNDPDPKIRRNRLALLAKLRDLMHEIADFSKIEG